MCAGISLGGRSCCRLSKGIGSLFLAFVVVLFGSSPAFSQGNAGRVLGTVTDQSGGAVVGATVTIVDTARGTTRTLTTDQAGEYNAPNLLPSTYNVTAAFQGFKTAERSGVILEVSQDLRVDLTLQPGEQTQKITVTEAAPLVETTNATLGGTLQSNIISDLPLNGRNFENLLQLRPGVTIYPGGSGWSQSTNGQRPHDNVYMVNGVLASDPWMGQSVFNAVEAAGDAGTILPVDAIDEFRTEENPPAEYGWKPGAVVNVGIKSGTNNLHGSAYAYGRDTALDARNFFNPPYAALATQQPVNLEQFGGTVGGAIKKDKIFYFTNFEGQRYSIGNPDSHKVPETIANPASPTSSLISSCLAAGAKLTPLSASLAGLSTKCVPLPGQPAGGFQGLFPANNTLSEGFITDSPSTNNVNGGLGKIDYHVNDKNSLEGMYFISQGNALTTDNATTEIAQQWLTVQQARSQAISGDWAFTPDSNRVNELRFGYAHYYQLFASNDNTQNPADYTFNGNTYEMPTGVTNPFDFGFPGITITGFNNAIGAGWPKQVGPDGVLQLVEHYSILHGKHAFMLGAEWLNNDSYEDVTANAKGPIRFSNLTNFFEGNPNRANLLVGNPARTLSSQNFAAFLQDDWRVKPRLTLNLGVRWEYDGVVHDQNNQLANFDPIRGLVQVGSGISTPYNPDYRDFSPRVGFAYDLFGGGKTVLRGGGSIIYEQMSYDVLEGVGNLLGLRSIPTGEPLFNNGSTTPIPPSGNIILDGLTFSGSSALAPVASAWQAFNPAVPAAGQPPLYASVANPACGDGVTKPGAPYVTAPPLCSIFGVNPNLRVPYVENWNLDIQHAISNNLSIDIGYVGNHGVKLLGKLDENQPQDVGGFSPGWGNPAVSGTAANACILSAADATPFDNCSPNATAEQAAQPFTAPCSNPALFTSLGGRLTSSGGPFNPNNSCFSYLQYITIVNNAYTSSYNGMQVTLTGRNYHGFNFTSGYTYSHALGEASDQGTSGYFPVPLNSYGNVRSELYTPTQFDLRHRFTLSVTYALPGRKGYGHMLEGWSVTSIVLAQSGAPWGLSDTTDDFTGTGEVNNASAGTEGEQWNFYGNPKDFTPINGWVDTNGGVLAGGAGGVPYFPGGNSASAPTTNAMCNAKAQALGPLAVASLYNLGCFANGSSVLIPAAYGSMGNTTPDMFRDAGFRDWDFSVIKKFALKENFNAEFRVEFFNLLNHPIFSNPTGGPGGATGDPSAGAGFGFSGATPDVLSSNPEIGSGGPRSIQLGMKLTF